MPYRIIEGCVKDHKDAVTDFFHRYKDDTVALASGIATAFAKKHKILFCGNGGSACDAMHIAGEFVGRFVNDRRALPAIAITADSGALTAIGNDYGFEQIFSRQVEAYGKKGDYLIAMSTSGKSKNVLNAIGAARKIGMFTVMLTGRKGHKHHDDLVDQMFVVHSDITARIQETHMMFLHVLTALVENEMFGKMTPDE